MIGRFLRRLNRARRESTLRGGYSPARFWDIWGKTFADEEYQRRILPQHDWLARRLAHAKIGSALEVGCGFGRNMRHLQHALPDVKIHGMDISGTMLDRAFREGIPAERLIRSSATDIPLRAASYDATFTMGLCMHVPPPAVARVIAELARVSREHVLLIEQAASPGDGIEARYTFIHDYGTLAAEAKLEIVDTTLVKNNETMACYHLRKVRP